MWNLGCAFGWKSVTVALKFYLFYNDRWFEMEMEFLYIWWSQFWNDENIKPYYHSNLVIHHPFGLARIQGEGLRDHV